jgi:signal peptidase I
MDNNPLNRRISLRQSTPTSISEPEATFVIEPRTSESLTVEKETVGLPGVRSVVREMLETAIFVLLIFLIVRGVIQNFKIEGQSMEPNFHTSQYILVNKIVYLHFDLNAPLRMLPGRSELPPNIIYPFGTPQRGDVVVFEYPRDVQKDYIKRVIALAGETVEIRDGLVYINDIQLDERYLNGLRTSCTADDICGPDKKYLVPEGTIFVMGDNRPHSSDSREWAALPLDRVIGKAWISYWPRDYWGVITTPGYAALP